MLSLFPGILYLSPLATTMLRVVAGLALIYMSYRYYEERETISRTNFVIVGRMPIWLTMFGVTVLFVAGVLLVIGLYTQAATIVGMIIAFKNVVFARKYPSILALSMSGSIFLFAICLLLLFTGAGAFGFDLPL